MEELVRVIEHDFLDLLLGRYIDFPKRKIGNWLRRLKSHSHNSSMCGSGILPRR